jgi:NAD(P)-dependent dehydrogenase (short-subunit alcohol dehydrogenase family)
LATNGWDVLAGVRSVADGHRIQAEGDGRIVPVQLDLCSYEDLAALRARIGGGLDALINNAGMVVDGPIEALDLQALRQQLEVNVIGQVAVTQAVLPQLRASRGRIVFISSLNGRISTPMSGAYNASKFAIEAIADALRVELRPWGVRVVLVEPGATSTDLWHNALDRFDEAAARMSAEHRELYAKHVDGTRRVMRALQKRALPVERVTRVVERALTSRSPRARYQIDLGSRAQLAGSAIAPTAMVDSIMARATGARK